ncbi:alpha/beta hydrolase [Sphingomicrobium sp. XHP0235]|uniref:alpha/beta hydrolase n=1 Tax=Sphingomicrobium aquimarinum TaxID=3133971 RepID=UPI0031FF1A93
MRFWLTAAVIALGAALLLLMALEERLLFPAHAVGEGEPLPEAAREIETRSAGGHRLVGIHIPPAQPSDLMVLIFPGNVWNSGDAAMLAHTLFPKAHVVSFHYRGYRASEGSPNAKALLADAPLVYDAALEATEAARVLVVGMSIGTGVATYLAADREAEGLILVTPFDSLRQVAADAIPMLPVGALFRNEIASAKALAAQQLPVAIIAAEQDEIISKPRTDGLRAVASNLVLDRTIAGAGHNDLYGRREFAAAMHEARDAILSR